MVRRTKRSKRSKRKTRKQRGGDPRTLAVAKPVSYIGDPDAVPTLQRVDAISAQDNANTAA